MWEDRQIAPITSLFYAVSAHNSTEKFFLISDQT
jgi:hypothetical protein